MKKFYDLTELLSGTSYPTANLFYRGFCEIKELLDKWCVGEDLTIRGMAAAMSAKFEKYWTKSSTVLAVACFLDSRYKKKLIEFYMRKCYGDLYQVQLEEFLSVIKKIYQFYASKKIYQFYASSMPSPSKTKSDATGPTRTDDLSMDDLNDELECFLYEQNSNDLDNLNELDKYMAEPLLKLLSPEFGSTKMGREAGRD